MVSVAQSKTLKIEQLIKKLKNHYPHAKCSLIYETPYQLLVATVLSAQCTDERVNKVMPNFIKKFKNPKQVSLSTQEAIEDVIRSTGFYKNKARAILELSKALLAKHSGNVPQTIEELTALRGVGRKTANVVLGNAFAIQSGIVVDTHVGRISRRLGLTKSIDPIRVEKDLVQIIPKNDWTVFSHLLILHGRALCKARRAFCQSCFLEKYCPKLGLKKMKRNQNDPRST